MSWPRWTRSSRASTRRPARRDLRRPRHAWERRAAALNARLEAAGLPVRIANLSSIWVVLYARPSRYNWMLQFYLRAEGLALGWTGTGRLIFSLDYTDADFAEVAGRFVRAAEAMERDGWWWCAPGTTNRSIRRAVLRELLAPPVLIGKPP
jgi:glutamate-1-semialdehyde 2,1-aminomutase